MTSPRSDDCCDGLGREYHHATPSGQKMARTREEVGSETHANTPPPATRLAPLSEVAGPQGWLTAPTYPSAGATLLAAASLASAADETVDARALDERRSTRRRRRNGWRSGTWS